jgi:hypothetical protein
MMRIGYKMEEEQNEQLLKEIEGGKRKIAINRKYGGFGITDEAFELYLEKKGIKWAEKESLGGYGGCIYYTIPKKEYDELCKESIKKNGNYKDVNSKGYTLSKYDIARDDEILIEVIEKLGIGKASDRFSEIKIVEIPANVKWKISEYDGMETIEEEHRSWC